MEIQRAKEIISSPVMKDVTYDGTKIYMESLDDTNQTCTIHYLNKPMHQLNVPLSSLKEMR